MVSKLALLRLLRPHDQQCFPGWVRVVETTEKAESLGHLKPQSTPSKISLMAQNDRRGNLRGGFKQGGEVVGEVGEPGGMVRHGAEHVGDDGVGGEYGDVERDYGLQTLWRRSKLYVRRRRDWRGGWNGGWQWWRGRRVPFPPVVIVGVLEAIAGFPRGVGWSLSSCLQSGHGLDRCNVFPALAWNSPKRDVPP